jgi:hypothetical protein
MGFIWCVDIFFHSSLDCFEFIRVPEIFNQHWSNNFINWRYRITSTAYPESMLVAVFEAAREGTRTGLKEFVPPKMETVEQLAKTEPPKPIPKESRGEKDQPEPQKRQS